MRAFLTRWWSRFVRVIERLFITRHDVATMSQPVTVNQRSRNLLGMMGTMAE